MYGLLGLILGVFCALLALTGAPFLRDAHLPFGGAVVGVFAVIDLPVVYWIVGGVATAVSALVYNLASGWVGGLQVEIN